ncbi:MAG TPA: hypothetical protein VIK72_19645 [Clostridiaceae bacterium]
MSENTKSIFLIFIAAVSLFVAIRSYTRLSKQDLKNAETQAKKELADAEAKIKAETMCETKSSSIIETKLDYISKGMDDIKLDNREHSRQINSMDTRLCTVEGSTKSAHKRIDEILK